MRQSVLFVSLLLLTQARRLHTTVRDMVELQIPGTYTRVSLGGQASACSASISVSQVEVHWSNSQQIFVVPHSLQRVPASPNGTLTCLDMPVTSNPLTKESSATILRRSRDVPPDRRFSLIDRLTVAREAYFVGYEHGGRVCNNYRAPDGTASIWTAPSQRIGAQFYDRMVSIEPGEKYIFFFSSPPCMYVGNASVIGKVVVLPTAAPPVNETMDPSAEPRPPDCFPGTARTEIRAKDGSLRKIEMAQVSVGDMVADGTGGWTRVLAQTHADALVPIQLVSIRAGNNTLQLSRGHVVVTKRGEVRASEVRVGDVMYGDGKRREIVVRRKASSMGTGRYAPVTESGTMTVDGLLVTTYAIETNTAHALLAPLRAAPSVMCRVVQVMCELGRSVLW